MKAHTYRLALPYLSPHQAYVIARLFPACGEWYAACSSPFSIFIWKKELSKHSPKYPLLAYYGTSALTSESVIYYNGQAVTIPCVPELEIEHLLHIRPYFISKFDLYYLDKNQHLSLACVERNGALISHQTLYWSVTAAHVQDPSKILVQCGDSIHERISDDSWCCVWNAAPPARQLRSIIFGLLHFIALLDEYDILHIYSIEQKTILASYAHVATLAEEREELIYLTHSGEIVRWMAGSADKQKVDEVIPFLNTYLIQRDGAYFHLSQYLVKIRREAISVHITK